MSKNTISILMTIAVFLCVFFPLLSNNYFSALLLVSTIFNLGSYSIQSYKKPLLLVALFLIIEILYSLVGLGFGINMSIFNSFYFFYAISLCCAIPNYKTKECTILLTSIGLLLVYEVVGTFIVLQTDPMAIRSFAYGTESDRSLLNLNYNSLRFRGMYSYGVGESLAFVSPLFLAFSIDSKKKYLIIISLIVAVGGIITQFMAALTTSAFLSALFCIVIIVKTSNVVGKRYKQVMFIIIGLIVTGLIIYPNLSIEENAAFLVKMEDINQSVSSGQSSGEVGSRMELYKRSISVFLHNPILGLGRTPQAFGSYTTDMVSLHTAIFDYLGMFGLFALLFTAGWIKTIKQIVNEMQLENRGLYKFAFYSLFFLLLLKGPVTIGINFLFSISLFCMIAHYKEIITLKDYE